jgi:acyl-CoA thioesterase FadM
MIFHCFDTVMFSDVDMSGMGHFAQQVRLLERAEYQMMTHVGLPPQEWFMKRYLFPRVKLEVQFFSPLQFADDIRFDVQVGHME